MTELTPTMTRVDAPGFYTMTAAQYHADPCPRPSLSASIAWMLCTESAAKAWHCHPRLNPHHVEEEAEAFDIGTAAHLIVLEGTQAPIRIVDGCSDWRTDKAKAVRDEARQAGLLPLLRKHYDHVVKMTTATRAMLDIHQDGRWMFKDGDPEVVAVWTVDVDGVEVWCRARIDYLRLDNPAQMAAGGIDDYKTTRASANPEQVARNMLKNGQSMQAVFYQHGVERLLGRRLPFLFAVQECFEPYLVSVNALAPSLEVLAQKQLAYALERWARCLTSEVWPGYGTRTAYAELPPWIETEWLDKEVRDAV